MLFDEHNPRHFHAKYGDSLALMTFIHWQRYLEETGKS
ncbi:MAG: hypothetical protein ACXWYD_16765 [Candidatus Binatia bacterium]